MGPFAWGGAALLATTIACAAGLLASCVDNLDAHYGAEGGAASADGAGDAFSDDGGPDAGSSDGSGGDAVVDVQLRDGAGDASIVFHGETQSGPTFSLGTPAQAAAGDLLIAGLFFGNVSSTGGPGITPPTGWTELGQTVIAPDNAALYVYWRVNDSTVVWPAQWKVTDTGAAWLLAYGGVDTTSAPTFMATQPKSSTGGTSWPSPVLANAEPGDVVVVTFGGWTYITDGGPPTTWTMPGPWSTRSMPLSDGAKRSGIVGDLHVTGPTFSLQVLARASGAPYPQYVTAGLLSLKPR